MKTKLSKQARLTQALLEGQNFTAKQITARFGIANPTATISDIRFSGVPVFTNHKTLEDGRKITVYSYRSCSSCRSCRWISCAVNGTCLILDSD